MIPEIQCYAIMRLWKIDADDFAVQCTKFARRVWCKARSVILQEAVTTCMALKVGETEYHNE